MAGISPKSFTSNYVNLRGKFLENKIELVARAQIENTESTQKKSIPKMGMPGGWVFA